MENLSIFEVITVAYRSRLLWRTAEQYREAWGASYETVRDNRDSSREMGIYYEALNEECFSVCGEMLGRVVYDYVEAWEFFNSPGWGARKHSASRKKFLRMLFRLYASGGKGLTGDETIKFQSNNDSDDARLTSLIFPNGFNKEPAIDLSFLLLFAYGIMPAPKGLDKSRGKDLEISEINEGLQKLRELILILKEDMPRIGSTEKPMVYQEWLDTLDDSIANEEAISNISTLIYFSAISDIGKLCRSIAFTERRVETNDQLSGYNMPGIWVDDTDNGETRFWIFPDNYLLAFCYSRYGAGWQLTPYELRMRFAKYADEADTFFMIDPTWNPEYMLSLDKPIADSQVATGRCKGERDVARGGYIKVKLKESSLNFPEWLDFKEWIRLEPEDERYREFAGVVKSIYDPENPQSRFFRNVAPGLSDAENCLVGSDNRYLYLFDWRPERFTLRQGKGEKWMYSSRIYEEHKQTPIFDLPVSEERPLYLLPHPLIKPEGDENRKRYSNRTAQLFAEIMEDFESINQICILHTDRQPNPLILFGNHSITLPLDMDLLKEVGVRKFTKGLMR